MDEYPVPRISVAARIEGTGSMEIGVRVLRCFLGETIRGRFGDEQLPLHSGAPVLHVISKAAICGFRYSHSLRSVCPMRYATCNAR
jgi:hypothetical protein